MADNITNKQILEAIQANSKAIQTLGSNIKLLDEKIDNVHESVKQNSQDIREIKTKLDRHWNAIDNAEKLAITNEDNLKEHIKKYHSN